MDNVILAWSQKQIKRKVWHDNNLVLYSYLFICYMIIFDPFSPEPIWVKDFLILKIFSDSRTMETLPPEQPNSEWEKPKSKQPSGHQRTNKVSFHIFLGIFQSNMFRRYFGTQKRANYLMDESSGNSTDFRFYNYRRVPYMGGSDNLK